MLGRYPLGALPLGAGDVATATQMDCATGAYSWAGVDADLHPGPQLYTLTHDFMVGGVAVELFYGYRFDVAVGSVGVAGIDATLGYRRTISCSSGSIGLVGQPVTVLRGYRFSGLPGGVSLVGSDAAMTVVTRWLSGVTGTVEVVGGAASLGYKKSWDVEAYAVVVGRSDSQLRAHRRISANNTAYAVAGFGLSVQRLVSVVAAPLGVVVGSGALTFLRGQVLHASPHALVVAGRSVESVRGRRWLVDAHDVVVAGPPAEMRAYRRLAGDGHPMVITWLMSTAGLLRQAVTEVGSYQLSGGGVGGLRRVPLDANARAIALAGVGVQMLGVRRLESMVGRLQVIGGVVSVPFVPGSARVIWGNARAGAGWGLQGRGSATLQMTGICHTDWRVARSTARWSRP